MANKYCPLCERVVEPVKKKFSWGIFILFLGLPYLIYRILFVRKNRCPVCGTKQLTSVNNAARQQMIQ